MGCRGGLFYKAMNKTLDNLRRDLQRICLLWRLAKIQAEPVPALFVTRCLLSWTIRSRIESFGKWVAWCKCTHVEGPQSVICALVLPWVELGGKVSFIVVFSDELPAVLGWIGRPSL